jgi:hypothetical protein
MAWLAAVAVLALMAAFAMRGEFRMPLNGDAAYHVDAAGRMLDGAVLYRDIYDLNPPFIFWASLPAAALGRDGNGATAIFRLFVLGVALLALVLGWRGTRGAPVLPLGFGLMALVLPIGYFGQREYLILALLFPYVCVAAARSEGEVPSPLLAIVAGAAAAVAILMKPTGIVVPLLVAVVYGHKGSLRSILVAEHLSMAAGFIAGGLAILLAAPEYLRVVSEIQEPYRRFNLQPWRTLLTRDIHIWSVWLALGLALLFGRRLPQRKRILVLALTTAGLGASAVLQRKGFGYHYFPAVGFAVILMFEVLFSRPHSGPGALARQLLAACCLLPVLYLFGSVAWRRANGVVTETRADQRVVARMLGERPTTVAVLSARISDAFPTVLEHDHRFVLRYPLFWAAALPVDARGTAAIRRQYGEDLDRHRPSALVVRDPDPSRLSGADVPVDYLAYLCHDDLARSVLAGYRLAERDGGFRLYHPTGEGEPACASS